MYRVIFALMLSCCTLLSATEYQPWFGNVYEFEGTIRYIGGLNGKLGRHKHLTSNQLQIGLMYTATQELATEVEVSGAQTSLHRHIGFEYVKLTERLLITNDHIGDCLSSSVGVSAAYNKMHFVRDVMLMHHAIFEVTGHLAFGKEFCSSKDSYYNSWFMALVGTGNQGKPWARAELHFGNMRCDAHMIDIFAQYERGFGSKHLHHAHNFRGYGDIHYTLVDVGLRYEYSRVGCAKFFAEIKQRVFANSCPHKVLTWEVGIDIPFSF